MLARPPIVWKRRPGKPSKMPKKVLVLGLDGTPYSFIKKMAGSGELPNLAGLIEQSGFQKMRSVIPTVSSVAWASYMTGVNPAKHGIFGFVDRHVDPFGIFIPTAAQLRRKTLWQILSHEGRRVVVINVPLTFPPHPVNGVMIGCFLAPSLEKGVYPPNLVPVLKEMGYRIDVDAWRARTDRNAFLEDLSHTLERRIQIAFHLMERESWDFFQLHIMGTDRINHFLWSAWEDNDPAWGSRFLDYYRSIDHHVGELLERLNRRIHGGEVQLLILSDHGFCRLEKELYVNAWLEREGYLHLPQDQDRKVHQYLPETRAYSLIPGRIFINLQGREERGKVPRGAAYEALLEELIQGLSELRDPENGRPMVRRVHRRERLYQGPLLAEAADLVLEPERGYDPKANVDKMELAAPGEIGGMHTLDDAFLLLYPGELPVLDWEIVDVMPGILKLLGIETPRGLDGKGWG